MNDSARPDMKSNDEPLLVLRYERWKVALRVVSWAFAGAFLGFLWALVMNRTSGATLTFATILGGFSVLAVVFLAVNTLLFKEARLYSDRIVKIWRRFKPVEVRLANARLVGRRSWQIQCKTFYDRRPKEGRTREEVIYYDEKLMRAEDVREMNRLLAELSGRRIEEFEANRMILDPLVKEGNKASS